MHPFLFAVSPLFGRSLLRQRVSTIGLLDLKPLSELTLTADSRARMPCGRGYSHHARASAALHTGSAPAYQRTYRQRSTTCPRHRRLESGAPKPKQPHTHCVSPLIYVYASNSAHLAAYRRPLWCLLAAMDCVDLACCLDADTHCVTPKRRCPTPSARGVGTQPQQLTQRLGELGCGVRCLYQNDGRSAY